MKDCVEEIPIMVQDSCNSVYLPTGSCNLKLWKTPYPLGRATQQRQGVCSVCHACYTLT